MQRLLQEFKVMKLGPARNLDNREIEIRLVFVDKTIVSFLMTYVRKPHTNL